MEEDYPSSTMTDKQKAHLHTPCKTLKKSKTPDEDRNIDSGLNPFETEFQVYIEFSIEKSYQILTGFKNKCSKTPQQKKTI